MKEKPNSDINVISRAKSHDNLNKIQPKSGQLLRGSTTLTSHKRNLIDKSRVSELLSALVANDMTIKNQKGEIIRLKNMVRIKEIEDSKLIGNDYIYNKNNHI